MKKIIVALLFIALHSASVSARASINIPAVLKKASYAYIQADVNAFLTTLIGKDVKVASNKHLARKADTLRNVERFYGPYKGLELVNTIQISDSTRVLFFIMKYQNGPLYGKITTYQENSDAREYITGFKVNTDIDEIIPVEILRKLADSY